MTEDNEARYRLPRTVTPERYRLTLEPDLAAATFSGIAEIDVVVHEPVTEIAVNAVDLGFGELARCLGRAPGRGREGPAGRRGGAGPPGAGGHHGRRRVDAAPRVRRRAERQAGGLLPVDVRGRRREDGGHRHHALRSHRRPSGVPVLGRARPESDLRDLGGRRRRPDRTIERSGGCPGDARRRAGADHVRRDDVDVDVPGGVRRRESGAHGTGRCRRGADARRPRPREVASCFRRARYRHALAQLVRRLLRHPLPGPQGGSRRAAGLRAGRDGEPRLHHLPRGRVAGGSRHRHA